MATVLVTASAKGDFEPGKPIIVNLGPTQGSPSAPAELTEGTDAILLLSTESYPPAYLISSIQGWFVVEPDHLETGSEVTLNEGLLRALNYEPTH